MFAFTVLATPSSILLNSEIQLSTNYQEFTNVFYSVKAITPPTVKPNTSTKQDPYGAYNLDQIRPPKDRQKTTFHRHLCTRLCLSNLKNTPPVLQHMANEFFQNFLHIYFTRVYQDDILIYLKTQEKHDVQVCPAIQQLHEYGLYAKLKSAVESTIK